MAPDPRVSSLSDMPQVVPCVPPPPPPPRYIPNGPPASSTVAQVEAAPKVQPVPIMPKSLSVASAGVSLMSTARHGPYELSV